MLNHESTTHGAGHAVASDAMTLQELHLGSKVWCILRSGPVEAILVQPGQFQSVLACPPQQVADRVLVEGGVVGFYYVDNRNLHFSEVEDAMRIDLPDCDIEKLVACFTETSDAIFMPTNPGTNPTKQISQEEPFFSECHIFMDAADRSASVGSAAGKFYSNQPGLNRYPVRKLDLEAQMLSETWKNGMFRDVEDDEVVVLRPLQGTAILFNGQVTHAGRAVSAGIRHAYVASFSLAALGELVLTSLSQTDQDGLSPSTFSKYVMLLLEVKTSQARTAIAETQGALEEEIQTYVLKKQTEFLIFAAWLATAIWRFSPQERNRLAYLEIGTAESFTQLSHLLRLPGLAVEVPEALPKSLEGELEDATVDSFIAVPEVYLDLLKDVRKRPCIKCQRLPDEPAMCLLCGAIVCVGRQDCRGSDTEGQCTTHARECTAGQSLFLLPYMAQVLAVSAPDCCLWDCPYVDKNGEPNPRLKRPCLMNFRLDARRWDNLRQIFVKSAVRREIFLYNEKTGQYIPEAL
eukprot:s1236_g4.t1